MITKLFLLGRPGSGKSTAAQYISKRARDQRWNVTRTHIDDYPILQKMTKSQPEKFHLKENGGFDAIDFSVFDIALMEVEQKVKEIESNEDGSIEHLVTIEFARDDYELALRVFNQDFIKESYLLFIDTHIETCLDRIHTRTVSPTCVDDHPSFSDEIYKVYYANDNCEYIELLQKKGQLPFKDVKFIENKKTLDDFTKSLAEFMDTVLQSRKAVGVK